MHDDDEDEPPEADLEAFEALFGGASENPALSLAHSKEKEERPKRKTLRRRVGGSASQISRLSQAIRRLPMEAWLGPCLHALDTFLKADNITTIEDSKGDKAQSAFQEGLASLYVLHKEHTYAERLLELGRILERFHYLPTALTCYRTANALAPNTLQPYDEAIRLCLRLGDDESVQELESERAQLALKLHG